MSTVHEAAALFPDPSELHVHLRALAVLDATIGDDPRFCAYAFHADWSPGEEAALMDNGSGTTSPSSSPRPACSSAASPTSRR